jgi:exopolysaccharide biosynthesis polyprenyl glycosylphosphotransferase
VVDGRETARQPRDYRVLLLAADLLMACLVFWGLLHVAPARWSFSPRSVAAAGILVAAWLATLFLWGQYTLYPWRPKLVSAYVVFKCIAAGTVAAAGLSVLVPLARPLPAGAYLLSALAMTLLAFLVRLAAVRLLPRHMITQRYLFLADGDGTQAFWKSLTRVSAPRYVDIVGAVAPGPELNGDGSLLPVLGTMNDLARLVKEHAVHTLVLAVPPVLTPEQVRRVMEVEELGVRVISPLTAHEEITQRTPLLTYNGCGEMGLETAQKSKYGTRIKRAMDFSVTLVLLPAGLLLMGLAALAVLLNDGAPVLYRQERVGRDGRPFSLLKIRTMVRNAEAQTGPVWAQQGDPRVTRVGRFLRSTRLDELPQLFNILRGEMSLVGPRPERPAFVQKFTDNIPFYEQRLLASPGLTGWAQVNHSYDRDEDDVREKLRYDLFYLRHLSFTLDLQILLATIGVVLTRRGSQ